ncbi:hypothetical protein TrVE_jg286 [Triparma verrucosa]|uniref:Protein kinase domain-containing protein n=1 Tax=Triparma verrucosa TaxID=1606542 RepID=A0A9W7CJU9_9STRA|nr:hypothetical protein TrVE_jg286 [Triparma verrucosa]
MSSQKQHLNTGENIHQHILIINLLGEGSFGCVYKASNLAGTSDWFERRRAEPNRERRGRYQPNIVAVKVISNSSNESETEKAMMEIEILSYCDSPFIVGYFDCFLRKNTNISSELWIVMEFCSGGSVSDLLEAAGESLSESVIKAVAASVILGLQYLHSAVKTVHRDIKCGNILITSDGHVKLADFGVSASIGNTVAKRKTVVGSPFWMAPEVIMENCYDGKADVWSLGISCIEMAESAPPHANLHPLRAIFIIPQKPPPTLADPDQWSPAMLDFVRICLHKNPSQRPDSSMISSHQFIRQDVSALRDIHSDESRKGGLPAIRSLLQKMGAKVDDVLSTRANSSSDDGKREFINNINQLTGRNGSGTIQRQQQSSLVRFGSSSGGAGLASTFVAASGPVGQNIPEQAIRFFEDDDEGGGSIRQPLRERAMSGDSNDNRNDEVKRPSPMQLHTPSRSSVSKKEKTAGARPPVFKNTDGQGNLSTSPREGGGFVKRNLSKIMNKMKDGHIVDSAQKQDAYAPSGEPAELVQEIFSLYEADGNGIAIPDGLAEDEMLSKQLHQLKKKLENEMVSLKISYELAKKQLIAEAQLRNNLPFDASELMQQAAKKSNITF